MFLLNKLKTCQNCLKIGNEIFTKALIFRLQFDLGNTNEIVLIVCDKTYHANKRTVQKGEKIKVVRYSALCLILVFLLC